MMSLGVICYLALVAMTARAEILIPGLSEECYAQPGDVLIGMTHRMTKYSDSEPDQCSNRTAGTYYVQVMEAFRFGIDQINADPMILPNITIGAILLDTCFVYRMCLGQSNYFLPSSDMLDPWAITPCDGVGPRPQYDVIGVIGTGSSDFTFPSALQMSTAQIPMIGTSETSDELSEESKFPYFVPLSLPNRHQAQTILQLLSQHNWTYFILIYSEGAYGEDGAKNIHKSVADYGLCIEASFLVYDLNFDAVIDYLEKYAISKVVVLFMSLTPGVKFFQALPVRMYNKFILVASDGTGCFTSYGPESTGMLSVCLKAEGSAEFEEYFRSLTPENNAANPWFDPLWEDLYDCSWSASSLPSCQQYYNLTVPASLALSEFASITIDAVGLLARGLHSLIETTCPEAFVNQSLIRGCVNGPEYLSHITNTSFGGISYNISFGGNGAAQSVFELRQRHSDGASFDVVGYWTIEDGLEIDTINWELYGGSDEDNIPLSVCSMPCLSRQYMIQKAVECCWDCLYCRDNEIVINGTSCQECEENTWPDEATATLCKPITAVYLQWHDTVGILLTSCVALGIFCTIVISALILKYREAKLIKASSKELMAFILVGILLTFIGSFIRLTEPSDLTCSLRQLTFAVSITVIYAPLVTKTVRIYRIFSSARHGKRNLSLISTRSLVVLTTLLIFIQVLGSLMVCIIQPSRPLARMPVLTENYSELICTLPLANQIIGLPFNLLLLTTCAVLGFLTRKLPENFNESWFLFISVATTTFLWMVILPTYYMTFYGYQKTALLATSLLLNGSIPLVCLFIPKLYAVKYVSEERLKFAPLGTNQITSNEAATASTLA